MEKFSVRIGLEKPKVDIQIDDMDKPLRNRFYNAYDTIIYKTLDRVDQSSLEEDIWEFFLEGRRNAGHYYPTVINSIFDGKWYKIVEFFEFIISSKGHYLDEYDLVPFFIKACNQIAEEKHFAYRIVDGLFIRITDKTEIGEIEGALEVTEGNGLDGAHEHLKTAIQAFAKRENTNYREVVNEAVKAIENIARLIVGDNDATLGDALKKIKNKLPKNKPLIDVLEKIYAYRSSEGGLGHSLKPEDEKNGDVGFDEAKLMLVTCSAFVNYLYSKADKAGLLNKTEDKV